jgi:hypothetical protein
LIFGQNYWLPRAELLAAKKGIDFGLLVGKAPSGTLCPWVTAKRLLTKSNIL